MKFLKSLFVTFLILLIIGGVGYIGYSYYFMDKMNMGNMSSDTSNNNKMSNMSGMSDMPGMGNNQSVQDQMTTNSAVSMNIVAVGNRNQLIEAINKINQAVDLITIDPYSKTTAPSQGASLQAPQSGTINIYPSGNSSLNIMPNGNTGNQLTQGMANAPLNNYVYDQSKLQQLNNAIFALAQGNFLLNELSTDLLEQSNTSLSGYQQYYYALQNKSKLDNALSMINQAVTLINVNPYASQSGYAYNIDAMNQMHQGVYNLAQGLAMLNKLSQSFTKQMSDAATSVYQSNGNSMNGMMNMSSGMNLGIFDNINLTTVFNILLILFVIGLFGGIIGAIHNLFKPKRSSDEVI